MSQSPHLQWPLAASFSLWSVVAPAADEVLEPGDAPSAQQTAAPAVSSPWPVRVTDNGRTFLIYQPQVDRWENNRLEGRSAVSVRNDASGQQNFGVVYFSARTELDPGSHTVTVRDAVVSKADFPDRDHRRRRLSVRIAAAVGGAIVARRAGPAAIRHGNRQARAAVVEAAAQERSASHLVQRTPRGAGPDRRQPGAASGRRYRTHAGNQYPRADPAGQGNVALLPVRGRPLDAGAKPGGSVVGHCEPVRATGTGEATRNPAGPGRPAGSGCRGGSRVARFPGCFRQHDADRVAADGRPGAILANRAHAIALRDQLTQQVVSRSEDAGSLRTDLRPLVSHDHVGTRPVDLRTGRKPARRLRDDSSRASDRKRAGSRAGHAAGA